MPPPLAPSLTALSVDERRRALKTTHPLYATHRDTWDILLSAYEGRGGFLSGDYLWKYPNELAEDFTKRKAQARYHNYVKTLVNSYVRHVFGQGITRTTSDAGLDAWWADVDTAGTDVETFMMRATRLALPLGHVGLLVDKTQDAPEGPSVAEERGRPLVTLYTPLAILDWRLEQGVELIGLKLAERIEEPDLLADAKDDAFRYLLWTPEEWARVDEEAETVTAIEHNLGRVPFVWFQPEPSAQYPVFGQPLVPAGLVRAMFNRGSEEDEVLRSQAFSVLALQVPPDGDVEEARNQLGPDIGTTRALVVKGTVDWKTPDQAVPGTIRENFKYLVQEIYRAAHVRWERDSLDAESAEAIRLQHSELNEMLTGLANEAQRVETALAKLYFSWTSPTPEAAEVAFERANVVIEYPREFFTRDLLAEIQETADAIALSLGPTFTARLKKRLVRTMDPDVDEPTLKTIDAELDTPADAAPQALADQLRTGTVGRLAAFRGREGA